MQRHIMTTACRPSNAATSKGVARNVSRITSGMPVHIEREKTGRRMHSFLFVDVYVDSKFTLKSSQKKKHRSSYLMYTFEI